MATAIEDLIGKVEFYVTKRMFVPAEHLATEFANDCSTSPLIESGYAILSIIVPYFEMVAQFTTGKSSKKASGQFFIKGFRAVYPCTCFSDVDITEIYERVRCGMFHDGMTRRLTRISRFYTVGFDQYGAELRLNPAKIVVEVKAHFGGYLTRLREPANTATRDCFQALCVEFGIGQIQPIASSTLTDTPTTPEPWAPYYRNSQADGEVA